MVTAAFKGKTVFWRLTDGDAGLGEMVLGHYDPVLVTLSVLVASVAGFAALTILDRIRAVDEEDHETRRWWLALGACAMGTGVWAMHFTGMLALTLPIKMSFDLTTTVISVLPAIVGAAFALKNMSRPSQEVNWMNLHLAALPEALGIGTMHYTGMEAMEMPAYLRYDIWLFILSIVVAHVLAYSALYVRFALGSEPDAGEELRHSPDWGMRIVASVLIGFAVSGMHYTAMYATEIYPDPGLAMPGGLDFAPVAMGATIVGCAVFIMGAAVIGAQVNRRFALLQMERRAAKEANRAKTRFLAQVSHDLRTPLNTILGMTDILRNDTELTDEQVEYVEICEHSGESLLNLINDLLDMSKIEAGELELSERTFEPERCIQKSCSLLIQRAHEKGLEFNVDLSPELPARLVGDPDRLRQVIVNLVKNAIKFTESGEVSVRAEPVEVSETECRLRIEVVDTGKGIAEEDQERIFEPFQQSEGAERDGTGLGLAICQRLVHQMGGELRVESEVGEGSRFSFDPVLEIAADTAEVPDRVLDDAKYPVDPEELRVLCVDDNENNRRILQRMLERWGAETKVVASAEAALEELRDPEGGAEYDLALIDKNMPGRDGFELYQELEEEEIEVPSVVMLTSSDVGSNRRRARELGFDGYSVKPLSWSQLLDAIVDAVGERTAEPGAEPDESDSEELEELEILVAEDNEKNRVLIETFLDEQPVDVRMVEDGEEALESFREEPPDLVLMDIQMPEVDGLEATRRLRDFEDGEGLDRTPIVALTAHAMDEHREQSLDAGCDEHITKPIEREDLYATIRRWTGEQREEIGAALSKAE